MQLVEQHIIKRGDKRYLLLDNICFKSKNLYNSALYTIRQEYFQNGGFLNWFAVDKKFKEEKQRDYYALPCKVSQQTLKKLGENFKSFLSLIKKKDYKRPVNMPSYLNKESGRYSVTYTIQAISKTYLKKGIIKLSKSNFQIKTTISPEKITQVRIVPRNSYYIVEVVYNEKVQDELENNGNYAAIDLGVNNLATVTFNNVKPFIINGRPVKSINQFANKRKAYLQSKLKGRRKTSKRIRSILRIRHNKIKDYMHKASRYLVNHLVSNKVNTLIIGKNDGWKQETDMGDVNNQNFVYIPHNQFIQMITYKAQMVGIKVIKTNESYTSLCSFMDDEEVKRHVVYQGKRIKRGLYKTSKNRYINADVNGSLNIMKKVVGKFQYPIEVCSTPLVKTMKFN